uniref:DUF3871 family protein n=1 Tax=Odoribacter laneus TaxID=626933 RepID=UPI003AF5B72E
NDKKQQKEQSSEITTDVTVAEQTENNIEEAVIIPENQPEETAKDLPFIESNTHAVTLDHLKKDCIIPVFAKDNELTISHHEFIESVLDAANDFYKGETIDRPEIRISHLVKGRTPEAIHKKKEELLVSEETLYYSRMAFNIQVSTIRENLFGDNLTLSISGCRSYENDNLGGRLTAQKFSLAVGFLNRVCSNQCLSTDGYREEIKASSASSLYQQALELFNQYNTAKHIHLMQSFGGAYLTEHQFCQILGRMRLYNYLDLEDQRNLPRLLITDSQINSVAKHYLQDENFAGEKSTGITMWKFYNLITGSNKNSYIHSFLSRSANATKTCEGITKALTGEDKEYGWFLE